MSTTIVFKRKKVIFDKLLESNYQDYLETDEWKEKVKEAGKEANYECQLCFQNVRGRGGGRLHHIEYDNLFNEQEEDMIFICAECHLDTHNQKVIT